jgi:hypothetical protein
VVRCSPSKDIKWILGLSTRRGLFEINVGDLKLDLSNAVTELEMDVQRTTVGSSLCQGSNYTHENWFHAIPLKDQAMMDQG